jgi:hypothetical protein
MSTYKETLIEVARFFEQNMRSSQAWYFNEDACRNIAKMLRSKHEELETMRAQLAEKDAMLRKCAKELVTLYDINAKVRNEALEKAAQINMVYLPNAYESPGTALTRCATAIRALKTEEK